MYKYIYIYIGMYYEMTYASNEQALVPVAGFAAQRTEHDNVLVHILNRPCRAAGCRESCQLRTSPEDHIKKDLVEHELGSSGKPPRIPGCFAMA